MCIYYNCTTGSFRIIIFSSHTIHWLFSVLCNTWPLLVENKAECPFFLWQSLLGDKFKTSFSSCSLGSSLSCTDFRLVVSFSLTEVSSSRVAFWPSSSCRGILLIHQPLNLLSVHIRHATVRVDLPDSLKYVRRDSLLSLFLAFELTDLFLLCRWASIMSTCTTRASFPA